MGALVWGLYSKGRHEILTCAGASRSGLALVGRVLGRHGERKRREVN